MSVLHRMRRALKNKVVQPDYAGLTNVIFHGRYEGLVSNTDNTFGTVDGSGNVTTLKSVAPHATGINFDYHFTAPTLQSDGIQFPGAGRLRHATAGTFNTMQFRSNINDLKWTVHAVVKFGNSDNPNAIYGLFGNNGNSSGNKGVSVGFDDRSSINLNNAMSVMIARGSSGNQITIASNNNIVFPNRWMDLWIQYDGSQPEDQQVEIVFNGYNYVIPNRRISTAMATGPTFVMEIGGLGGAVAPALMTLKEITFMDGLMSESFRQEFITARMFKYGIEAFPTQIDGVPIRSDWDLYDILDEGRYYLTNHLLQKPSDADTIVSIFQDGTQHAYDSGKKISLRKSIDRGETWATKTTVFDPAGAPAAWDPSAAWVGSRIHVMCNTNISLTAGAADNKLWYLYSDDDGATWSTEVDLTSVLPSDSLAAFRCHCKMIENNGRLMLAMFKFTDEGDHANNAIYLLYSDDGGANWATKTIMASSTTFNTECDIVALSSSDLLVLARNDTTFEWQQYMSTDNGDNWTNQGDVSFGEAFTRAAPVRLKKFQISSTDVIACYYSDRALDFYKVIYAKASDLIASGISAWNLQLKYTIHKGINDEHLHYGDVIHYNNDFAAIGMSVIDPFPGSGSGTSNKMYTFYIPTFHYPFIKSALGL